MTRGSDPSKALKSNISIGLRLVLAHRLWQNLPYISVTLCVESASSSDRSVPKEKQ